MSTTGPPLSKVLDKWSFAEMLQAVDVINSNEKSSGPAVGEAAF